LEKYKLPSSEGVKEFQGDGCNHRAEKANKEQVMLHSPKMGSHTSATSPEQSGKSASSGHQLK
jgi:hypothetical protein